jgi:hypothetical protein
MKKELADAFQKMIIDLMDINEKNQHIVSGLINNPERIKDLLLAIENPLGRILSGNCIEPTHPFDYQKIINESTYKGFPIKIDKEIVNQIDLTKPWTENERNRKYNPIKVDEIRIPLTFKELETFLEKTHKYFALTLAELCIALEHKHIELCYAGGYLNFIVFIQTKTGRIMVTVTSDKGAVMITQPSWKDDDLTPHRYELISGY